MPLHGSNSRPNSHPSNHRDMFVKRQMPIEDDNQNRQIILDDWPYDNIEQGRWQKTISDGFTEMRRRTRRRRYRHSKGVEV